MSEKEFFLELSEITESDVFRVRVEDDEDAIERYKDVFIKYKEAKDRGENPVYPFPPIIVRKNGEMYNPVTGYHRSKGARRAGRKKILVTLFEGSEDEALKIALKDNREHALPLTRGDLKYCIKKALNRFSADLTPAVIADMLCCSESYAYKIESQLCTSGELTRPEKRRGADGKVRSVRRPKQQNQQSEEVEEEQQDEAQRRAAEAIEPEEEDVKNGNDEEVETENETSEEDDAPPVSRRSTRRAESAPSEEDGDEDGDEKEEEKDDTSSDSKLATRRVGPASALADDNTEDTPKPTTVSSDAATVKSLAKEIYELANSLKAKMDEMLELCGNEKDSNGTFKRMRKTVRDTLFGD